MEEKSYVSREKLKELEAELDNLKTVERKTVAEHLEYAKSLGDLSENAEYHEARDRQADIEDRIQEIEQILKTAVIIEEHHTGSRIEIGSSVSVKKDKGEETHYTIVGSEEADMAGGKISFHSPLGGSLLGKKAGDDVVVTTPKGEVWYKIVSVK